MAQVSGRVVAVRFKGEDFCVFALSVASSSIELEEKTITVAGPLLGLLQLRVGLTVGFVGRVMQHPKHGRQFVPVGWYPWAPTPHDLERFLGEAIPDFSDSALLDVLTRNYSAEELFRLLDSNQAVLQGLFPLGTALREKLDRALLGWSRARQHSQLSNFLSDFDVDSQTIRNVCSSFETGALEIIQRNPYRLMGIPGVTLTLADRLAFRAGIAPNDPVRFEGIVTHVLRQEANNGHLYVRRGDMVTLVDGLVENDVLEPFDVPDLSVALLAAMDRMVEAKMLACDPEAGVYLPELWGYEREGARMLSGFVGSTSLSVDTDKFIEEYERVNRITLSDAQREGIEKLGQGRLLVLTGAPGTGKTTLIRAFVRLFREHSVSYSLMAPTGIAAKRLASVTGSDASTIHRAFGYDGEAWTYHGGNKFNAGAVIVDELSMVDQELFFRLLDALHPDTILVLVGDDAQLPSVGPGNVLRELLACAAVPKVRLTRIFRQQGGSEIVSVAHAINQGESVSLAKRPTESEFHFLPVADEGAIADFIVRMAEKLKGRDATFQVITPKYEGVVGVHNLNDKLRDALNPSIGQPEFKAGKFHVRLGDRLMVVQNQYKRTIYNGDMGKLVEIRRDELLVRIHGVGPGAIDTVVSIPKSEAVQLLRLAYAITAHKSQGSEFDTVIMPVVRSQGRMLQRNLLYTAITRAKQKCWVLGDPFAFYQAVGNDKVVQRNTRFGAAVFEALRDSLGVCIGHERSNEAH